MLFRLQILLIVGGGFLGFYGFQEFRAGAGASVTPVEVNLADLEQGTAPPNKHLTIGDHIALYPMCIYEWEQVNNEPESPASKLNYLYYPLISMEHPFMKSEEENASIGSYAVLVRTKNFRTVGEVPDLPAPVTSITGLVTGKGSKLKQEERNYLAQDVPGMNFDNVIILEEGRKPTGSMASIGMIVGALILMGLGVAWMITGFASK